MKTRFFTEDSEHLARNGQEVVVVDRKANHDTIGNPMHGIVFEDGFTLLAFEYEVVVGA